MALTQNGLWLGWSKPPGNVRSVSIWITLLDFEIPPRLGEDIANF